jgi:DNA repair protein RecN (Recombination protein N)
MLVNLHVRNLALIEEADINFSNGLNILTGETGAGKSIILGSINIALGGKAPADLIRAGADYALTELLFSIDDEKVKNALLDFGVEELDEGELLISRKITAGRSQIKVNGQNFTAAQVRAFSSLLIDIHGQHDNQLLLNDTHHMEILENFAKETLAQKKEQVRCAYQEYAKVKQELDALDTDAESRNREIAFMEFEVQEIEGAHLKENEDEQLEADFKKMSHSQKIMEELAVVENLLVSGNGNVCDNFSQALRALNSVAGYDDALQGLSDTMADIESLLLDASHMTADYIEESHFDEAEFIEIQQRLDFINSLKMKYGRTITDILSYCEERRERLEKLVNFDERLSVLKKDLQKKHNTALKLAEELSDLRKKAAEELSEKIQKSLLELNFKDVRFDVHFEKNANISANGIDSVYFMIATNPGEDLKPLAKIASGGELSRIMLAIRTVTASKENIHTMIFDEIDAGISGRTAQLVAQKLSKLAADGQIICITHLPQIASMADAHYMIEKTVKENVTSTDIFRINEEQTIEELARLLGGSSLTEAVYANAKEMRKFALEYKKL